jgi:hypothetical protein
MVLTLEEILPLHKGTSSYTEYEFGTAFVEHMMDNEHLDDCKMAHIHSHNTMGVFFSSTDWSELEDNAPNHNFYLSLIVNNFMDFCAKVCFIVEATNTRKFDFTGKDENGEKYIYNSEDYVVETKKLVVYDCDIISPSNEIVINDNFKRKVKTIVEDSEKRTKVVAYSGYGTKTGLKNTPAFVSPRDWNSRINAQQKQEDRNAWGGSWDAKSYSVPIIEDEDDALEDAMEEFTMFVLNTGNDTTEFNNITGVVKNYKGYNLSGRALAKGILDKYVPLYEKFFDQLPDKDDPNMFMHITEQVIEILEDERDSSTLKCMEEMLNPTIGGLKSMLSKFKNFEKV